MTFDGLMKGKKGLIMGVANDRSIAWGVAKALHAAGAELAFTYQGDVFKKRVAPLVETVKPRALIDCDVSDQGSIDAAFAELRKHWDNLDFLVHAIAHSDRNELKGRYVDTSRANFIRSLSISCYSFTAAAQRATRLMLPPSKGGRGGALLTLTYLGSTRVAPNYNVMGVAKAGLEASVRYLAADLGPDGIRVNAISAGPMRTLAGSVIGESRLIYRWNKAHSPLKKNIELDHVGNAALYLVSDLSEGVTGEIHFVDAGFHVIGTPPSSDLKGWIAPNGENNEDVCEENSGAQVDA